MEYAEFIFYSIGQLYHDKCTAIPNEKGIYVIIVPDSFMVEFSNQTTAISEFNGQTLLYPKAELISKFDRTDKKVLYIGKAGGAKNRLKQRIRQYIKYGYKESNNHRGGRAIWQISNNKHLLIGYLICDAPEAKEQQLLVEYYKKYQTYPVANWVG